MVNVLIPVKVIRNVYEIIVKIVTNHAAVSDNGTIYINKIRELCRLLFTSDRINNLPCFANITTGLQKFFPKMI